MLDALNIALDLSRPEQHLESESHRLGMDAMRTADARRMLELHRTAAQDLTELLQVIQDNSGSITHHHAVSRILDIAGRQPFMNILGIITNIFCHIGQESNDVMMSH